jgi:hypothetical protein
LVVKFSFGIPGLHREDKKVTAEVTASKGIAKDSGRWVKDLWPKGAMDGVKKKGNEARSYHDKVTLPFGAKGDDGESDGKKKPSAIAGLGILPAVSWPDYAAKMAQFSGELDVLIGEFLADPWKWINWAVTAHNGTFDPANYPGCAKDSSGAITLDVDVFRDKMRKKFYLEFEPLPVPDSSHFSAMVSQMLGTDAQSVGWRVASAEEEARKELMRRMKDPVTHMAYKLAGQPCPCSNCKGKPALTAGFKDSLIENVREIAALVPSLNITGDSQLAEFGKQLEGLANYLPDSLRTDESLRDEAQKKAKATLDRLASYSL